jgi:hypothetical protein
MKRIVSSLSLAAVLGVSAVQSQAATIQIDNFADFGLSGGDVGFEASTAGNVFTSNDSYTSGPNTIETSSLFKFSGGAPTSQTFLWTYSGGVGPTRELSYTITGSGSSMMMEHVFNTSTNNTVSSKFGLSSANNNTDFFSLTYDNLGGADFSSQDAFLLQLVTDHFGNNGASNPQDISITVEDTSGKIATVTNSLTSNPAGFTANTQYNMYLAYADLVGDVVDMTSIESLVLNYEGDKGHDMEMNFFAVANIPASEPGALGLLALGALGLFSVRRRNLRS